jgi:hypothetical protein
MKRREMLRRCPQEYFCHYYGAAGGAFANIFTRRAEKLHLLKSLSETELYVKMLLCSGIRDLFNSGASTPENFAPHVLEQFAKEFRDMLLGKPEQDHKRPLLLELTRGKSAPGILAEKITLLLKEEIKCAEEKLLPELLKIPIDSRIPLPFPLKINWCGAGCYVTPLAAWQSSGTFNVLCTGTESEENSALLHFYALEKFQTPPGNVNIFHLASGELAPAGKRFSASGALRRIREDLDQMLFLDLQLKSGTPIEKLFPPRYETCGSCRFYSYCFNDL